MISRLSRFEALKLVVEAYGSQEATGDALGVDQSTVSRWLTQSKQMPAPYVLVAERDTGVSRHDLRPDIYPVELHGSAPRWCGVDMDAAPDVMAVSPVRTQRNGNRINLLDTPRARRVAG